jgi:dihydroneopterin aldolase
LPESFFMYTIALKNLEFFAFHGFYPQEQLTGNAYLLDISVEIPGAQVRAEHMETTVNYETLFGIARSVMSTPYKLLESVVEEIHIQVSSRYPFVHSIDVVLTKKHPPIDFMKGDSVVALKKYYHESL